MRRGKHLDLVTIPKRCSAHRAKEVLVKVLKEHARRCCWVVLLEKIVTLLIMTTGYPRQVHMGCSAVNVLVGGTRPFP